jgi:hypothetical protein
MDSVGNAGNDHSCRVGGRFSAGRHCVNISADGRFVAFCSDASNLVRGDINKAPDLFLLDRLMGLTIRVGVSNTGTRGNYESLHTALSADGRVVVCASRASSLVWGDRGGPYVFVHDRQGSSSPSVSGMPSPSSAPMATIPSVVLKAPM